MSLWATKEVMTASKLNQKQVYVGASAPGSPTQGQLWYDTVNDVLKAYDGAAWKTVTVDNITEIPNRSHDDLQGLLDDDHTQYCSLNKANQTLMEDLAVAADKTIDGVDLSKYTLEYVFWHHGGSEHPIYAGSNVFIRFLEEKSNDYSFWGACQSIRKDCVLLLTVFRVSGNTLDAYAKMQLYINELWAGDQHSTTISTSDSYVTKEIAGQPVNLNAGDVIAFRVKASNATSGSLKISGLATLLAFSNS